MESTEELSDKLSGKMALADSSSISGSLLLSVRDHRILHVTGCFQGPDTFLHTLATAALNTWKGAAELSGRTPDSLEFSESGLKYILVSGKLG